MKILLLESNTYSLVKDYSGFNAESKLFEVLDYVYLKDSKNFNLSKIYSKKQIDSGEDVKNIWYRFRNLLKYTEEITIIDRYLFENDFNSAYDPDLGYSSIRRFFKFMTTSGIKVKRLNFISSNKNIRQEDVEKLFSDILRADGSFLHCFKTLRVILRNDKLFSDKFHDRLIKTDFHYVEIGAGFGEAFRGCATEKFMTFSCKSSKDVDYRSYISYLSDPNIVLNESIKNIQGVFNNI